MGGSEKKGCHLSSAATSHGQQRHGLQGACACIDDTRVGSFLKDLVRWPVIFASLPHGPPGHSPACCLCPLMNVCPTMAGRFNQLLEELWAASVDATNTTALVHNTWQLALCCKGESVSLCLSFSAAKAAALFLWVAATHTHKTCIHTHGGHKPLNYNTLSLINMYNDCPAYKEGKVVTLHMSMLPPVYVQALDAGRMLFASQFCSFLIILPPLT